jgi:alpha-galactosidase
MCLLVFLRENVVGRPMIEIRHITEILTVSDLDDPSWQQASEIVVDTYWSAEKAPAGREFRTGLLWSDTALYVRFMAMQKEDEPLVVNAEPDLQGKTVGLWERDVCEIFIAPDLASPTKYFEFEIAPTGEWLDLAIEITPEGRKTDWTFASNLQAAAQVRARSIVMALRIPFASLTKTPAPGDIWLGNLFRCVGTEASRGYLSWQPTGTEKPDFHVPTAFGRFAFVK